MNEADIPIDISLNKLQDFLVTRRIVDKNWARNLNNAKIREKISSALQDVPAHPELIQLLSGTQINYFHCKKIVEILKITEADSKNFLGGYGSQRMKAWQEILKLYEKDSMYLGEAAQTLVRNMQYDIPGLKKQISKMEQSAEEAEKKRLDSIKSENILKNEHTAACQQLGIKGQHLRAELADKLKELPELQNRVAKSITNAQKPLSLYANFSNNQLCLPILRHLVTSGNSTVYEYLYSEPPLSIEEPPLKFKLDDITTTKNIEDGVIDFGDEPAIDFGEINYEDDGEIDLEPGNIDWGTETAAEEAEINFDISLEESGIVVEEGGNAGGVAKGDEAYLILDSPLYKDKLLDELYELEAFLKMRLYELSTNDKVHILSMSLLDGFTEHDAKTVTQMIGYVDVIISSITTSLMQQLFQIKHSPKYVDILTTKFTQKLKAIEKLKKMQELLKEKAILLKKEALEIQPSLKKLIEQTKVLEVDIQNDISKRYKMRTVNLMGGTNTL